MTESDPFFGRDARYFTDEQYRDSSNLAPRWLLHEEYSTASVPWFEWVALQIEWQRGAQVLELGCGLALMVFPYFVSNSWLVFAIGVGLMAVPYFLRL